MEVKSNYFWILIFYLITYTSVSIGKRITIEDNSFQRQIIQDKIGHLYSNTFQNMAELLLSILPKTDAALSEVLQSVSKDCSGHFRLWVHHLEELRRNRTHSAPLWALHMVDAFGKIPDGILSGHINSLGDFDECVGIRASDIEIPKSLEEELAGISKSFTGRYCHTYLVPVTKNESKPDPSAIQPVLQDAVSPIELIYLLQKMQGTVVTFAPSTGACFPSSCSEIDIKSLTKKIVNQIPLGPFTLDPVPFYCTTEEKPPLDVADISVIVLLGILVGLCLFAGILDIWLHRNVSKPPSHGLALQYLLAFSFYTNIRKCLNTKAAPDDLGCVHGFRFISTTWVILAHTWYVVAFVPQWNMVDAANIHEDWAVFVILNSTISVDTFFILSGMLVTYNLLKILQKNDGQLNIPMFYIHRYLRLTPAYAILIGIMATIIPYLGSGPVWRIMEVWSQFCEENWWTNLLYVNNFVRSNRMCQGEAWYLATDMQFYILSPIWIFPLWKWPNIGVGILGFSAVVSTIIPAVQVYLADAVVPTTIATRFMGNWFQDIYIKPYSRIQTYLIGVALGYVLFRKRGRKIRISKWIQLLGWTVAAGSAISVIYGIVPWFNSSNEIPRITGTIYAGLNRLGWGFAVSWVIFVCIKGHGGLLNDFLSWKPFIPLGRLCYCVFLVSLHLQMILHLNFRQPITYDGYTMTNFFFAHIFMSFLVGFFCTLIMESPFIILQRLVFDATFPQKPAHVIPLHESQQERFGIFYQKEHVVINTNSIQDKNV